MKKLILLSIGLLISFQVLAISVEPPVPKIVTNPLIMPSGSSNPEITQENIKQTICVPNWSAAHRPSRSWSSKLKAKMMYRVRKTLPGAKFSDYELDHDMSISSGGNPYDINNLWLQPWYNTATRLGAYSKDRVERKVHKDICSGKITLEQGRQVFIEGWEKEYNRVYGTKK